jgi:hypothetical protein
MSIKTQVRILRTGRPNVPTVNEGADDRINWGVMAGVFAATNLTGLARGYVEIRDEQAFTVTVSDG